MNMCCPVEDRVRPAGPTMGAAVDASYVNSTVAALDEPSYTTRVSPVMRLSKLIDSETINLVKRDNGRQDTSNGFLQKIEQNAVVHGKYRQAASSK